MFFRIGVVAANCLLFAFRSLNLDYEVNGLYIQETVPLTMELCRM